MLEYFAFFRKSTSFYRAYNVKVTAMLVDMADFFIKQNKKKPADLFGQQA